MQQFLAAVCAETYPHSETSVLKMGILKCSKKMRLKQNESSKSCVFF